MGIVSRAVKLAIQCQHDIMLSDIPTKLTQETSRSILWKLVEEPAYQSTNMTLQTLVIEPKLVRRLSRNSQ